MRSMLALLRARLNSSTTFYVVQCSDERNIICPQHDPPPPDDEATIVLPCWLKTLRGAEKCCKEREIEDKEFLSVHFLAWYY